MTVFTKELKQTSYHEERIPTSKSFNVKKSEIRKISSASLTYDHMHNYEKKFTEIMRMI